MMVWLRLHHLLVVKTQHTSAVKELKARALFHMELLPVESDLPEWEGKFKCLT
jgi:hypothetical protein